VAAELWVHKRVSALASATASLSIVWLSSQSIEEQHLGQQMNQSIN